ncbi:RDH8 dehydrogenase, partial [Todus mexicanus]|nr:RDH8 dehydrogenase [Todus mexicanus]
VIATMRDLRKAVKLEEAAGPALGKTLSIQRLDVCSDASVAECMEKIPGGRVDILGELLGGLPRAGGESPGSLEGSPSPADVVLRARLERGWAPGAPRSSPTHPSHGFTISPHLHPPGIVFNDVYAASKFAVEGFCESLAVQLLRFNV